jgi:hypothetical protein
MPKPCPAEGSDRQGQLVERGGNSKACWLLDRELVVAAPKVLDQGVPANTTVALRFCLSPRIGRSRAFGRPWSHSMRLLGYWSVRCHVAGSRSSSTSGYAAARSVVTSRRDPRRADGPLEEPAGSRRVPPLRDEYVDDLPELVDRTVDIAPPAGDLHPGLVDLPAVIDSVAAGPGGLGERSTQR